jgi:hypothetical protein
VRPYQRAALISYRKYTAIPLFMVIAFGVASFAFGNAEPALQGPD